MRTKYASTRFSIVKRSKGQSAVDAASYISRSVLVSEYDGKTYRPKYHEDLVHCEINLPEYAPEEWLDRAVLWNSVELNEKQKNAQLCRTLKAALPNDWSYELAEETVRDYVQRNFVSKGMCADWAIHDSVNQNGIHNLHFHLMLTLRPVEENGKWGAKQRKEYILDKDGNKIRNKSGRGFKSRAVDVNDWNEKGNSRKWRKDLTDTINVVNDRIGLPEYWEHRSFKELGLEQEPTRHLGPIASALERKGIRTEKGDANRAIMEHNQTLQRARMFYDIAWNSVKNLEKWEQEKAAEAAKNAAEKKAGKMAGDIPAAQEGEAEQTAVGSIQKETSGTKEVSVFAAMKNEVLEMLECILAAFGRLHLPLIQAPNLKKVSNRAALMDIENVRRFVEEKGIDSFEALETFAVPQEADEMMYQPKHPLCHPLGAAQGVLVLVRCSYGALALDGTCGDTFNELILCTEEYDQLRQDGDEGQCKDLVPCKAGITVHRQLDEQGHGVFAGGADVKQRAHKVVAAPHELEQCAGHQSGSQHGHDDLVQGLERGAAVNGGSLVQITRDVAHELHQLIHEVGLGSKCAVHPDGQIEGAVHPAELVVQQVLGHVQHDLRQEQGGQHDVEQQLAAGEVETAKAVSGNTGRHHSADHLGDDIAVSVEHGLQDVDGAAEVVQGVAVAIQRRLFDPQADACKDLAVILEGSADHPQQRIDHDDTNQDQHEVLKEGCDLIRCFHSHIGHLTFHPSSRPTSSGW